MLEMHFMEICEMHKRKEKEPDYKRPLLWKIWAWPCEYDPGIGNWRCAFLCCLWLRPSRREREVSWNSKKSAVIFSLCHTHNCPDFALHITLLAVRSSRCLLNSSFVLEEWSGVAIPASSLQKLDKIIKAILKSQRKWLSLPRYISWLSMKWSVFFVDQKRKSA